MHLAGRHVMITGAGKRVGRAIADALLAAPDAKGMKLTAHYRRSRTEAEALAADARRRGVEVFCVAADLSDVASLQKAAAAAEAKLGPVDVLVNSASDFYPTPALGASEKDWDHLMDVNLKGQFFLSQAVAKSMQSRGGVIINIADVNGERALPRYVPYACSKAGLLMMTRSLAKEWAPRVRVNAVSPGAVLLPESYDEAQKQKAIDRSLLKRLGSAEDVANGVRFLIANDYITGFNLCVDGGRGIA